MHDNNGAIFAVAALAAHTAQVETRPIGGGRFLLLAVGQRLLVVVGWLLLTAGTWTLQLPLNRWATPQNDAMIPPL